MITWYSLFIIGISYYTSVVCFKGLNGLTSDLLNIGQVLRIPQS